MDDKEQENVDQIKEYLYGRVVEASNNLFAETSDPNKVWCVPIHPALEQTIIELVVLELDEGETKDQLTAYLVARELDPEGDHRAPVKVNLNLKDIRDD